MRNFSLMAVMSAFYGAMAALFVFIVLVNLLAFVISKLWFWLLILAVATAVLYGIVCWHRYRRDGW